MSLMFGPEQVSPESGTYQREISHMMHGFGDSPVPSPQTVSLVESIVLHQMRSILQDATRQSERRGNKCICPEDIIFLMRNNKIKLQRMLSFMKIKSSYKSKAKIINEGYVPSVLLEDDGDAALKKKKKTFSEMVESLDDTGELAKCLEFDSVKQQRNLRANRIAQSLNLEKYEAYHKARCVSFGFFHKLGTNTNLRLKQWLCPLNDLNIAAQALDLISYLSYETVAQIVDLAFLVRQDSRSTLNDPFSKLHGGNYCNPVSLGNSLFVKSGQEGVPPLTVAEVREAMRRFSTPRIGIVGIFSRNIKNEMPIKYLAI